MKLHTIKIENPVEGNYIYSGKFPEHQTDKKHIWRVKHFGSKCTTHFRIHINFINIFNTNCALRIKRRKQNKVYKALFFLFNRNKAEIIKNYRFLYVYGRGKKKSTN